MKSICALALLAPTFGNGQASQSEQLVYGTWRFDVAAMRIDLEPRAKKQMLSEGKFGANQFEGAKDHLRHIYAAVTFVFGRNHRFSLIHGTSTLVTTGPWTLKDHLIAATSDRPNLHMPVFTLTPSGTKIIAAYTYPGLGKMYIPLIKAGSKR